MPTEAHPKLDSLLRQGIADQAFPGAAYACLARGKEFTGYIGNQTYDLDSPAISDHSLFDLASLTKVLVTTTAALLQAMDGALILDQAVQELVPDFIGKGKENVTIRHLLQHNSGLPAHREFWKLSDAERWRGILSEPLEAPAGDRTAYSCVGFLVLQQVLQTLTGERYDDAWTWGFHRLCSKLDAELLFNPTNTSRCVPTEGGLQGVVHDENARSLGGIAGNAGLFGTLEGVRKLVNLVTFGEPSVLDTRLLNQWRVRQAVKDASSTRALGWDTRSDIGPMSGSRFSSDSFGHSGFTGTSIWIDPNAEIGVVLLTNRVFPTRDNLRLQALRPRFHDLAFELLCEGE